MMRSLSLHDLRLFFYACLFIISLATKHSVAQPAIAANNKFPDHAIRLVVPYPPGGAADALARIVGNKLSETWGQPVVIENRAGAGGLIGTEYVARATPDGYTILLGALSTHVVGPLINKVSFDPFADFDRITPAVIAPWVLVVGNAVKAQSLGELIKLAQAEPGKLNFASYGTGSGNHLAMELLTSMAQAPMTHIPYNGSSPAMTALIGGQVDVMFDSLASALPQIKAGKVRALAVSGPTRSFVAPDVPTAAEAGVPGYGLLAWWGFYTPSKTPAAIVQRLNQDISRVLNDASLKKPLADLGLEAFTTSPEEMLIMERRDLEKWGQLVKQAGIQPQ